MNDAIFPPPAQAEHEPVLPPTLLGWAARVFSIAIVLALVGVVAWKGLAPDRPVAFTAKVDTQELRRDGEDWLVPVEITNTGSRGAQFIVLELTAAGEATEVDVDMMGAEETRRVVIPAPAPARAVETRVLRFEE